MKLRLRIFIISILIIFVGVSSYFLFFRKEKNNDSENSLTISEKILLNDNEKEIFELLSQVRENLLKGDEEENTDDSTVNLAISSSSIELKDFCSKIYEIRKYEDSIYIIDMDVIFKDKAPARKKVLVSNGKVTMINISEEDLNLESESESEEQDPNEISLGKEFYEALISKINETISEYWDNSTTFDNVDYENIYKLI